MGDGASPILPRYFIIAALLPGCAHGSTVMMTQQPASDDRPALPLMTAERLSECARDFAGQLEPASYGFSPHVRVDHEGRVLDVSTEDMPASASDLAACTRIVLRDMAVPGWLLQIRPMRQAQAGNLMGSPTIVVLGVTVVFADLVLQAGGITILFAVAVEVVDTAVKEIAEVGGRNWKDKCTDHYEKCMDTRTGDVVGNVHRESRCGTCRNICQWTQKWPSQIYHGDGYGSCEYWIPGWL